MLYFPLVQKKTCAIVWGRLGQRLRGSLGHSATCFTSVNNNNYIYYKILYLYCRLMHNFFFYPIQDDNAPVMTKGEIVTKLSKQGLW